MKLEMSNFLNAHRLLIISVVINLVLVGVLLWQINRPKLEDNQNKVLGVINQHPPVRSSEDFHSERSHFTYSSDRKYIAFVQNVFDEYGQDWDKYWALKVYNPETKEEKELVVDNSKMSSYLWLDNENIKLDHSAGTGVRVFLNVSANREATLFTKNYEATTLWIPDTNYSEKVKSNLEAERTYYKDNPTVK